MKNETIQFVESELKSTINALNTEINTLDAVSVKICRDILATLYNSLKLLKYLKNE